MGYFFLIGIERAPMEGRYFCNNEAGEKITSSILPHTRISTYLTSALARARTVLIRVHRASHRATVVGATAVTIACIVALKLAAGRFERLCPSSSHHAENSGKLIPPLPFLSKAREQSSSILLKLASLRNRKTLWS